MLTFAKFRKLMCEKRELTISEKVELSAYFHERKECLDTHQRIAHDIMHELSEINKRLGKLP